MVLRRVGRGVVVRPERDQASRVPSIQRRFGSVTASEALDLHFRHDGPIALGADVGHDAHRPEPDFVAQLPNPTLA